MYLKCGCGNLISVIEGDTALTRAKQTVCPRCHSLVEVRPVSSELQPPSGSEAAPPFHTENCTLVDSTPTAAPQPTVGETAVEPLVVPLDAMPARNLIAALEDMPPTTAPVQMTSDPVEVIEPIGAGGLGEVFAARDKGLNRIVALKKVRKTLGNESVYRARLIKEARLTGQLEHPAIVPIYSVGEDSQGQAYYTMKRFQGHTLHVLIQLHHREGPAEVSKDLLRRFITICDATAFAHNRCFIHRDIKPANILVGDYSETLLIDWGLARQFVDPRRPKPADASNALLDPLGEDGSDHRVAVGTPPYMAPEQANGISSLYGPPMDIFALGATLFEILVGFPPLDGKSSREVREYFDSHENVPKAREFNPLVPAALEAIAAKAMARYPKDRYATATELGKDVQRWLDDEPVIAYRDPLSVRIRRWSRKHRAVVAAGAAVVISLIIGLIANNILVSREERKAQLAYASGLVAQANALSAAGQQSEASRVYTRALETTTRLGQYSDWARLGLFLHYRQDNRVPMLALTGHERPIVATALTPDEMWAVTADDTGTLIKWDLLTGTPASPAAAPPWTTGDVKLYAMAIAPGGKFLATGGSRNVVRFWNLQQEEIGRPQPVPGEAMGIKCLAFAADSKSVITGTGNGKIVRWRVPTPGEPSPAPEILGTHPSVKSLASAPGQPWCLSGSSDGSLLAWNLQSNTPAVPLARFPTGIAGLAWTSVGTELRAIAAERSGTLHWWTVTSDASTGALTLGADHPIAQREGPISSLAAVGNKLYCGTPSGMIRLLDMDSGQVLGTLDRHENTVRTLAMGPSTLLSGAENGHVFAWSLPQPPLSLPLTLHMDNTFVPALNT